MSQDSSVSAIYGQAAFNLAKERGHVDAIEKDVVAVTSFLQQPIGKRFQSFLENPSVPTDNKLSVVKKSIGSMVGPMIANLYKMLIVRNRADAIPGILAYIKSLIDTDRGFKPATVTTAVPIKDDEANRLRNALESYTGSKLAIDYKVDRGILGGVVFQFGDTLIDNSLRYRMKGVRSAMKKAAVAKFSVEGPA